MNTSTIVASTAGASFSVDLEGRITAWNAVATKEFGHRPTEVIGQFCWAVLRGRDVFHNRYCNPKCPLRLMAQRGEPVHRAQMNFRDATGEERAFSVSVFVVPGRTPATSEVVHLVEPALSGRDTHDARSPRPARANRNAKLSPREAEVLALMAEGKTTREIAEVLCISPTTVRNHIQKVLCKLRVHNRLGAVALARRIGLI